MWLHQRQLMGVNYDLILPIVILQLVVAGCNCFEFDYKTKFSDTNLTLDGNATVGNDGSVLLLPAPNPSLRSYPDLNQTTEVWSGWMTYNKAIHFLGSTSNPDKAHSFNTSFTFKFTTPDPVDEDSPSGMAFIITNTPTRPESFSNRYFGFGNSTYPESYFAVEFDTRESTGTNDPSASHIGIDISNINSSVIVDTSNTSSNSYYPQLYLYNNYTFTVWISYDASLQVSKVWMTNDTESYAGHLNPPDDQVLSPIMEWTEDLTSVFANNSDNMYVGFSAGTQSDSAMLGVIIYSWYFSVSDTPTAYVGPPTAAPSPSPILTSPSSATTTPSPPPPTTSSPTPQPNQGHHRHCLERYSIVLIISLAILALNCF